MAQATAKPAAGSGQAVTAAGAQGAGLRKQFNQHSLLWNECLEQVRLVPECVSIISQRMGSEWSVQARAGEQVISAGAGVGA